MHAEGRESPPAPQAGQELLAQELARVKVSLQRQLDIWAALNEIAEIITSTSNEGEVLRRVTATVRHTLSAEHAVLLFLDQHSGELHSAATSTVDDSTEQQAWASQSPRKVCPALVCDQPLLVSDGHSDRDRCSLAELLTDLEPCSILCAPLKAKGCTVGVLELVGKADITDHASFGPDDIDLLWTLSPWVAVIAENTRLSRSAHQMPAEVALKRIVVALAHHINNRLMAFSLELDERESQKAVWRDQDIRELLESARSHIWQISAVVKALDMLDEIGAAPYLGTTDMADIEQALNHQLRKSI